MDRNFKRSEKKDRIGKNIKIKKYDDIFDDGADMSVKNNDSEAAVFIKVTELRDFKDHPFKIIGKGIDELKESILEHGVLSPIIVRPINSGLGGYEIISGHRRKYCAIELGMESVPVIIKNFGDDEAVLAMVDSNIQREDILPSERAFACKMKLEAIKKQGKRTDLTSGQVVQRFSGSDTVGNEYNKSGRQIRRYIRLTELSETLLDAVDSKKMSVNAGVILSYLSDEKKDIIEYVIKKTNRFPTLSHSKKIRELSDSGAIFNEDTVSEILSGKISKANENGNAVNFEREEIKKHFPDWYTARQIEEAVIKILENYNNR